MSFSIIDSLWRHIHRKHSQELSLTPSNNQSGEQDIHSDHEYKGDMYSDTKDTVPPVISCKYNNIHSHCTV